MSQQGIRLIVVALVISMSCASLRTSEDSLNKVVDGFHHDVRWKYNDTAVARVEPRFSADLLDELEAMKDLLFITGCEIRRVEPDPSNQSVKVKVLFSYYRMPSTVVKEELAVQVWKKTGETWYLLSQEGGPFTVPVVKQNNPSSEDKPSEKDSIDEPSAE